METIVTSSEAASVKWAKVIDHTKCIGCHACSTACKSENQVPLSVNRTYVKYVDVGTFPHVRRAFQVTRCNQCQDVPCTQAYPTAAMYTRADGIVDFDKSICIGCKAWVTEGIRPGIAGCSHHMGRWKLEHAGQDQLMATVSLDQNGNQWDLQRKKGVDATVSQDADRARVWWTDGGVHQNLTFPVHPDPISGMHCWHQAVRLTRAKSSDRYGDIHVDTEKSHAAYAKWLQLTRPADQVSPDGSRRPYWLLRPLKPGRDVYQLPHADNAERAEPARGE